MKKIFGFTLMAAAVAVSTGAFAQADVKWPTRPVQVIVPAGAGGDKGKKGRHQYGADEGRQDLADAAEDNISHHLHSSEDQA